MLLWLEEEWEPGPREDRAEEEREPDERNALPDDLEDDLEALDREEWELELCLLGGIDDRLLLNPYGNLRVKACHRTYFRIQTACSTLPKTVKTWKTA